MSVPQVRDLQVEQDLEFQQWIWVVQRIGWGAIALIVIAALAGLFGAGPLSSQTAVSDGVVVEYNRFARFTAPTSLVVRVAADEIRGDRIRLWVDGDYLEAIHIQRITPLPHSVTLTQGGQVYEFKTQPAVDRASITFHLTVDEIGSLTGAIGLEGETPARFSQFVYP